MKGEKKEQGEERGWRWGKESRNRKRETKMYESYTTS